jgi:integrase/recombinase XerD
MLRNGSKIPRHKYVDIIPNRHDRTKYFSFFRRDGVRIPLTSFGPVGSDSWLAAYADCLRGKRPAPKRIASSVKPGTFEHWINVYTSSAEFAVFKKQQNRITSFKRIREIGLGDIDAAACTRDELGKVVGELAREKPGAAIDLLAAFGAIYRTANLPNPLAGYKKPPRANPAGHYSWEESEVEQYRKHHPLGTTARLALEIMLNTALRCSDACRVGPGTDTLTRDGDIKLVQQKLERFGERAEVVIPIHPRLREAIDRMKVPGLRTWLRKERGQPFTANELSAAFGGWCDEARLPRRCRAHGLRKLCATRLIDAGVPVADAAALTGHLTMDELLFYALKRDKRLGAKRSVATIA